MIIQTWVLAVFSNPIDYDNNIIRTKDLDTAETFWNVFSQGNGQGGNRGYSGWGTGQGVLPNLAYSPYGTYGGDGIFGNYGQYGSYGNNYYGKYPVYSGYITGQTQPTYENYGLHGGHGFGKYGKY